MQIPISIYIYLFFYVYIFFIYAFNEVLCFQLLPPPTGSAPCTLPSPGTERWALPPAAARGGWECTGVPGHRCSGAARSRRAPKAGLCYCGFFRMRPCLKS